MDSIFMESSVLPGLYEWNLSETNSHRNSAPVRILAAQLSSVIVSEARRRLLISHAVTTRQGL